MDIGSLLNARSPRTENRPSPAASRHGGRPSKRTSPPMQNQIVPLPDVAGPSDVGEHISYAANYSLQHSLSQGFRNHLQPSSEPMALSAPMDHQDVSLTGAAHRRLRSEYSSLSYSDNGSLISDPPGSETVSVSREISTDQQGSTTKTYPCPSCTKTFARRSDLARHDRIHTGTRPHVCDVCLKPFIQRSALTVHKRVHTGEKPHTCDQCEKKFSDSSSLARHRRTHDGSRPHICLHPGCSKTFTRRTTLRRHEMHHSGLTDDNVSVPPRLDPDRKAQAKLAKSLPSVPEEDDVSQVSSPMGSEQRFPRRASLPSGNTIIGMPVYQPVSAFPAEVQINASLAMQSSHSAPSPFPGTQPHMVVAPAQTGPDPQQHVYMAAGRMSTGPASSVSMHDAGEQQYGTIGYSGSNYFSPQTHVSQPYRYSAGIPTDTGLEQDAYCAGPPGRRMDIDPVAQYQWQRLVAGEMWAQSRPLS